jgi:hypothetical protein
MGKIIRAVMLSTLQSTKMGKSTGATPPFCQWAKELGNVINSTFQAKQKAPDEGLYHTTD